MLQIHILSIHFLKLLFARSIVKVQGCFVFVFVFAFAFVLYVAANLARSSLLNKYCFSFRLIPEGCCGNKCLFNKLVQHTVWKCLVFSLCSECMKFLFCPVLPPPDLCFR